MAILDASAATVEFDMTEVHLVAFDVSLTTLPGLFEWWSMGPNRISAISDAADLTYTMGRPSGGGVNGVEIDVGDDDGANPDIVISGLTVSAEGLVSIDSAAQSAGRFWETVLGGADTIIAPTAVSSTMFGDFLTVALGESRGGMNDVFEGAEAYVGQQFAGDAYSNRGELGGGDDVITVRTTLAWFVSGDVNQNEGVGAELFGGDDTIVIESTVSPSSRSAYGDVNFNTGVVHGGDDTITGGTGDAHDIIVGDVSVQSEGEVNGGDDTIFGRGGNDVLVGDVWMLHSGAIGFGHDTIDGGDGNDTIYGDFETNTAGFFTISEGFDTLSGGAGDDTLTGGGGGDDLDGGEGFDTASFMGGNGVTVSLLAGTAQFGDAQGDTLDSIENLTGSDFFDELTGSTAANVLSGMGGNDFINGSNGDDELNGGDGDDVLIGGAGADDLQGGNNSDEVNYSNSDAAVQINLATGFGGGGHAGGDVISDVEIITGSAFADTLTGGTGAETFNGGNGADTLNASLGADRLHGNQAIDTADYSGSAASVGVNLLSGVGSGLGSFAEGDLITGVENLIGSAFDDSLTGTTGVNVLEGGDGADSFNASNGNDQIFGGNGHDDMVGGSGADTFDGGAGGDWVYYSNAAAVNVSLAANSGVGSHATGDSFASVENLFGSVANDTLTGEGGVNTLNGSFGHDTLNGVGGDDVLLGGVGDDWLNGSAGDDVLSGYLGFDTFVYNLAGFGEDTIIGFEDGVDVFDLNAGLTFADFTETAAGPGTILSLTVDPSHTITILGVPPTDIDAGDFV